MSSPPSPDLTSIFQEPPEYFRPPKPATYESCTLPTGETFHLRLVGHDPLWAHHIWNGARTTTTHLHAYAPSLVRGKTILELGAGAGLPSLAAALWGAKTVVMTDYAEPDLLSNMRHNISSTTPLLPPSAHIVAEGYIWGRDPTSLLAHLSLTKSSGNGFDTLILADLLFNHSQHPALVSTVQGTLARNKDAVALVFFTPYRPWLLELDLRFFELAREAGLQVEKVVEERMERVMFEDDPGDEGLRRTVFGFELRWGGLQAEV
ncbi:MAG: hypothetical protein Q9214_001019 [Letrouitia sp. 1 TL-2023]